MARIRPKRRREVVILNGAKQEWVALYFAQSTPTCTLDRSRSSDQGTCRPSWVGRVLDVVAVGPQPQLAEDVGQQAQIRRDEA